MVVVFFQLLKLPSIWFFSNAMQGEYLELLECIKDKSVVFPFIAHIIDEQQGEHYIVVHEIVGKKIVIADPSKGIEIYTEKQFLMKWTGYIVSFKRNGETMSYTNILQKAESKLAIYFKMGFKSKKTLMLICILSLLLLLGNIYSSIFIGELYQCNNNTFVEQAELYITGSSSSNICMLIEGAINSFMRGIQSFDNVCFVLIGLSVLAFIFKCIRSVLISYLSKEMDRKMMKSLFQHIIDMPLKSLVKYKTGEIIARFTDSQYVRAVVISVVVSLIVDMGAIILFGSLLFYISKTLLRIVLIIFCLYIMCAWFGRVPFKVVNRNVLERNAQVTSYLKETIDGIETIKCFNMEKERKESGCIQLKQLTSNIFLKNNFEMIYNNLTEMIYSIGIVCLIWKGANEYFNGNINVESLLIFLIITSYFFEPVKNIANLYPIIQRGIVAFERVKDIEDVDVEKKEQIHKIEHINNGIEISDASFSYGCGDFGLKNININIKKGENVAIVGDSGSGKTTLVKLLVGFNRISEGQILIDNFPLENIDLCHLRKRIVYVSQNMCFFTDTIKKNLLINSECSEEEMLRICKLCKVDEFVSKLPFAYNTIMLEKGSNFSAGQKQRWAIARALIQKPDVIIFDESTSNLDAVTENAIKKAINMYKDNMAYIFIAHRISSIKD